MTYSLIDTAIITSDETCEKSIDKINKCIIRENRCMDKIEQTVTEHR